MVSIVVPEYGDPTVMFTLSQTLVQLAEGYIAALEAEANQLVPPVINPDFPTVSSAPQPNTVTPPNLIDVTWAVPAEPPPFTGGIDITSILPGPFTGVQPPLDIGAPPIDTVPSVPPSPPIDLNFVYPTVAVTLPTAPALLSLDTVPFNPVSIPPFDIEVPQLAISAPNTFFYKEGTFYNSRLLCKVTRSLEDAVENGAWTGLPPAIETNLWDRAREREYRQMADALDELERMEDMGFAFPPGVYLDARIKMQTEMQNTTAGLSRDIATKQAELILTNINKARDVAVTLESKLIDYVNQIAQRTFEAAKYVTEAAIAIYNAEVEAFKASLDGYRTQAVVYQAQIEGLKTQVQVLQIEIEFEKTKADINTALVAQYTAEVQAALAVLQIYKTQVEIIQTQASVEKIKVDVFNAQIQAFLGQVNAYAADVEAYKATIQAQATVQEAYKTSVEAYTAEVNAGVAEANVLIEELKAQVETYTAQLDGYKAAITGMVGQAQAASLYNTAEADVYRASVAAITSFNQVLVAEWQAVVNEQLQVTQIGVAAAKANGDLYIAARGLALDASKVGAQVTAQLGAAALGAIHWANTASVSLSASLSDNTNTNINE